MNEQSKFNIGDHVRIINYGHIIWVNKKFPKEYLNLHIIGEQDNIIFIDMYPELVGEKGVVSKISHTQGQSEYSLSGVKGKASWYNDNQLELIQH